jgi:nitronate monooxygenase
MTAEVAAVRSSTSEPFGINVFVPGRPTAEPGRLARYVGSLAGDAEAAGAALGDPVWDDDGWAAKLSALLADPPAIVSFTFGCPSAEVLAALRDAGSLVAVTVTSPAEARRADAAGADCLCVQGAEAGAHRGTFGNDERAAAPGRDVLTLTAAVAGASGLPLIAAGGIMDAGAVTAVRRAGAVAAQCGTAFLRCPESGAHPVHKAALADDRFTSTALTRSFSGRPARGLVNRFMLEHPDAPAAYPEINNATRPMRAAAAQRGDAHRMSLWAGTGFRQAAERPAAEVVDLLSAGAD